MVPSPPEYRTLATFHIPLEHFLDGDNYVVEKVFTLEVTKEPEPEAEPEDAQDGKKKVWQILCYMYHHYHLLISYKIFKKFYKFAHIIPVACKKLNFSPLMSESHVNFKNKMQTTRIHFCHHVDQP